MSRRGMVAAGHALTAEAGQRILEEGGNAFDAAVAAFFAACVAEPVLASLGGGGFLLARPADAKPVICDFFVQTPKHRRATGEIDFYPVLADFGSATQEFHIGLGSVATPGCVRGMFEIQRRWCQLPMQRLLEPAIEMARSGVPVNRFQACIENVIRPILNHSEPLSALYENPLEPGQPLTEGDTQRFTHLADTLEQLARDGERFFYEGEPAAGVVSRYADGGQLTRSDFTDYRVEIREPLRFRYRGADIFTNPLPSTGGALISFLLRLMGGFRPKDNGFGSAGHLHHLVQAMAVTNQARADVSKSNQADDIVRGLSLLEQEPVYQQYLRTCDQLLQAKKGTTHISIIDKAGSVASLTTSNGEGCGYLVPGTDIMMNNMLGEQDLNPDGFQRWTPNQRMCSMMAPTLVCLGNDREIVLGSGGSNRIRTAIAQVLINLVDFRMGISKAVSQPRLHYEHGRLGIEPGFSQKALDDLMKHFPDYHLWQEQNLYFGGVHGVDRDRAGISGAGDTRRGGEVSATGNG